MERVYGVQVIAYGHAGDGNLHLRIIKPNDMPLDEWHALYRPFLDDYYRRVARLGGTITPNTDRFQTVRLPADRHG